MLTGSLGGGARDLVAAKAVVQHGCGVLGKRDCSSLAAFGRVFAARLDHLQSLGLLPAPSGEHERRVSKGRAARSLRDRISFFDQAPQPRRTLRRARARLRDRWLRAGAP